MSKEQFLDSFLLQVSHFSKSKKPKIFYPNSECYEYNLALLAFMVFHRRRAEIDERQRTPSFWNEARVIFPALPQLGLADLLYCSPAYGKKRLAELLNVRSVVRLNEIRSGVLISSALTNNERASLLQKIDQARREKAAFAIDYSNSLFNAWPTVLGFLRSSARRLHRSRLGDILQAAG